MRCLKCGWLVMDKRCPCGPAAIIPKKGPVPIGTKVVFRFGRGPSMVFWTTGEVVRHQGKLHEVSTRSSSYWCESADLLPPSQERDADLAEGTRVWALWLDGRWFPGVIDGVEGTIRHVAFDDGDAMWLETHQMVVLTAEAEELDEGATVLAKHWNGEVQPARVEQRDGSRCQVVFQDGEEAWVETADLTTFPPNPFGDE